MTRVPALDGVRGLAVALVVAEHQRVLAGGWIGVSLFFTLSGYLITSLLLAEHDRTGGISLRSFYRRRVARLAPALLVALAATWAIWTLLGHGPLVTVNVLVALVYLANVVRGLWPQQMSPASWAWSLSLEEQFYFLWPLTLRRWLRQNRSVQHLAALLVTMAIAIELARIPLASHIDLTYTLVRGDEILLGSALALAPRMCPRWLTVAGLVGLMVLSQVEVRQGLAVNVTAATWCSLILVASANRLSPVLSVAPLRYLGRISYALYLWDGVLAPLPPDVHIHRLPLSIALAILSTHMLEEPLRRRLTRSMPHDLDLADEDVRRAKHLHPPVAVTDGSEVERRAPGVVHTAT